MNNFTEYSLLIDDMIHSIIENDGIDDDMIEPILNIFEMFFCNARNNIIVDWLSVCSLIFAYEYTKSSNNLINKAIDRVKVFIVQNATNRHSINTSVPIPSPNNSRFNNFIEQHAQGGV